MALGAQLPVRLELDVEMRLETAAKKYGTTKSGIIRMLASSFVEQVVSPDGTVHLPPNWKDLLPEADQRSLKIKNQSGNVNLIQNSPGASQKNFSNRSHPSSSKEGKSYLLAESHTKQMPTTSQKKNKVSYEKKKKKKE
jgi:hypothetical protein